MKNKFFGNKVVFIVTAVVVALAVLLAGCAKTANAIQGSMQKEAICSANNNYFDCNNRTDSRKAEERDNDNIAVAIQQSISDDCQDKSSESDYLRTYSFAIYETAYTLTNHGYDVFRGFAVVSEETMVCGLIYTKYERDLNGNLTCGFMELLEAEQKPAITLGIVQSGIVAVADSDIQQEGFVISFAETLPASSGVYGGFYFKTIYSGFAAKITVESADVDKDESITCLNYNTGETMWMAEITPYMNLSAISLYTEDEIMAHNTAVEALQQICEIQDKNAYSDEYMTCILIETAVLESIILAEQQGAIGCDETFYDLKELNGITLASNQILVITATDGVQVLTMPTEEEIRQAAEMRETAGIIQVISGILMTIGSVAICTVTGGVATPLVITAISLVSATVALTYSMSNIIEGVSNIYYGKNGDIYSSSINPIKDMIINAVGDEKKGEIIYHVIGIGSSILQNMTLVVGKAIALSGTIGASVGQTVAIVTRALAVETVKLTTAIGIGYIASKVGSKIATNIGLSPADVQKVSFVSGLISGILCAKVITALDKRFNFSGLYSKHSLKLVFDRLNDELLEKDAAKYFEDHSDWLRMSMDEKEALLRNAAEFLKQDLGIKGKVDVRFFYEESNLRGYYDRKTATINLNRYWFEACAYTESDSASQMLRVLAHELRHQLQFELDMFNGIDYVAYDEHLGNYNEYYNCIYETDAREYAEQIVNILRDIRGW